MNKSQGDLRINNIIVNEQINKNTFISYFKSYLMPYSENDNVLVFSKSYNIDDMDFWIVVGFDNGNIAYVELENSDEKLKNSYSNWCNNKVNLKKKSHDQWLKKILGTPDEVKDNEIIYNLNWGIVTSYIEPRSGSVCITIRYRIIHKEETI